MNKAYVIAANRTAVVPRNGAFAKLQAHELAAPLIRNILATAELEPDRIDSVVMGNALYGGGNPARMAALLAGLPVTVPALTIDSQCCSGMDAIAHGVHRILAGTDHVVIAGGLESWSRSPQRFIRPLDEHAPVVEYSRPPFSPWPERDPDMLDSVAELASMHAVDRQSQETFAMRSHQKSMTARQRMMASEIVAISGIDLDQFTRVLSLGLCKRLPVLAGNEAHGLTTATVAVEADAAATVLIVSETVLQSLSLSWRPMRVSGVVATGSDPATPALAPVSACRKLIGWAGLTAKDIEVAEVMEAFAVQAMLCIDMIGLDPAKTNCGGGGLSRGHPVGASGAINVVRLWHELQTREAGRIGLATIAAAGGLGSAICGEIQ